MQVACPQGIHERVGVVGVVGGGTRAEAQEGHGALEPRQE